MNYLNLDKSKAEAIAKELNVLLADYSMYYQKIRNFHWNIVGPHFFVLHEKFEEMYQDAQEKVDEIAERILTLRFEPTSNFSDYLKMTNLEESSSELKDKDMVKALLADHGKLLEQMGKVIELADDAGDEGTLDLIGAFVSELEKLSWMLDAWTMEKVDTHQSL